MFCLILYNFKSSWLRNTTSEFQKTFQCLKLCSDWTIYWSQYELKYCSSNSPKIKWFLFLQINFRRNIRMRFNITAGSIKSPELWKSSIRAINLFFGKPSSHWSAISGESEWVQRVWQPQQFLSVCLWEPVNKPHPPGFTLQTHFTSHITSCRVVLKHAGLLWKSSSKDLHMFGVTDY